MSFCAIRSYIGNWWFDRLYIMFMSHLIGSLHYCSHLGLRLTSVFYKINTCSFVLIFVFKLQ